MTQSPHVLVIGAGPGGLASAMLAANSGARVTLLERGSRPGGRCSSIEDEGFRFDLGPTFFLYPRILREIFATCGKSLDDYVELIRLDPQYRLIFENSGHIDATGDVERMKQEIARIAPDDAKGLESYLAENRTKLKAFRPVLERPFQTLWRFLDPQILGALRFLDPTRSVDGSLQRHFADPRVRMAFSFQSKYLGMSPFQCPSLFSILAFLEYEHGVFHPRGGCGAVSEAMARAASELGVDIRYDAEVESLALDGRRVRGAQVAGQKIDADAVILNADFAYSMRHLVPDEVRKRWNDRRLERAKYSCSTFMLYLGLDRSYKDLPHHTIFLSEDFRRNIDEIQDQKILPTAPSMYVQNACVTEPELAPEGKSTLYVLVPVPHDGSGVNWSEHAPAFRAQTLARLESGLGLEGLSDAIVYERMLTPDQWRDDLHIYRGATFNLAHSLDQMLYWRPRNRFEDLQNCYLVGGGTHPGSGLPVIFESARISTTLMQADLGLRTQQRSTDMDHFDEVIT